MKIKVLRASFSNSGSVSKTVNKTLITEFIRTSKTHIARLLLATPNDKASVVLRVLGFHFFQTLIYICRLGLVEENYIVFEGSNTDA